mgnify:CR=1 FL=1
MTDKSKKQPSQYPKNIDAIKKQIDDIQEQKNNLTSRQSELRKLHAKALDYKYYSDTYGKEIADLDFGTNRFNAIEAANHEKQRLEALEIYGEEIGSIMDYQSRLYAMKEARDRGEVIDDVDGKFQKTNDEIHDYSRWNKLRKKNKPYDVYKNSEIDFFFNEMQDESNQDLFVTNKKALRQKSIAVALSWVSGLLLLVILIFINKLPIIIVLIAALTLCLVALRGWLAYVKSRHFIIGYKDAYEKINKLADELLPDDSQVNK